MLRFFVVVSVSAALAEITPGMAASSTPVYPVNHGSIEIVLAQSPPNLPSSNSGSTANLPAPAAENTQNISQDSKRQTSGKLPSLSGHHSVSNNPLVSNATNASPTTESQSDDRQSNRAANNTSDRAERNRQTRSDRHQENASPPLVTSPGVSVSASALTSPPPSSASGSNSSSTQAQIIPIDRPIPSNRLPETLIPRNLQPNPNPLQFPTRPQEVDIEVTQPLTLQQAIELARRNNRNLQVATLQLERAQAALREQQAALYPTVDLQVDATSQRSTGSEFQAERLRQANQSDAGVDDPTFSVNGTLQFNYNVLNGGRRTAQIRAAQEQVRFNQLEVERLNEQTRLDITTAYYDVQQAEQQVRISEGAVTAALQGLRDAKALEEAGLGTKLDTLRAQVQLANENQNLIKARADRRINQRQLVNLLSLPQSVDIEAVDPVQIAGIWELPLEESIVLAFQNRAELQQQLAQRNINQQQRRIAQAARRPQLSLVANYNMLDVFNDGLGLADGYSIGARLNWSLFDAGAASARASQSEADIAIAETQFANTRNQIRFQVEQAYNNLQANFLNINTASVALEQAREALRLANLRFQAGVGTQTEVIDAQNELTTAEGNRVQAILNYNRALATLQRAISNLPSSTP